MIIFFFANEEIVKKLFLRILKMIKRAKKSRLTFNYNILQVKQVKYAYDSCDQKFCTAYCIS